MPRGWFDENNPDRRKLWIDRLLRTFHEIEDRHGSRQAVLALWRMGKRSGYHAAGTRPDRKPNKRKNA